MNKKVVIGIISAAITLAKTALDIINSLNDDKD